MGPAELNEILQYLHNYELHSSDSTALVFDAYSCIVLPVPFICIPINL